MVSRTQAQSNNVCINYPYPVSRVSHYPVSRIPLSCIPRDTHPCIPYPVIPCRGPSSAQRRSHARLAPLARSSSSLPARCISARPPRGPRPPSWRPRPRHRPRAYRWVGGAEWSPKSPRPSPRLRDEALVALRRGRGARRGGWRGCFQALLVELSARSSIQEQLAILFPKSVAKRHHTYGLAARCSVARLSL